MKFILEKEVQTIKVLEKVSFKDARKKALERQIRPGVAFSSVLKRPQSRVQIPAANVVQQQLPVIPLPAVNLKEQVPDSSIPAANVEQQQPLVVSTKSKEVEKNPAKQHSDTNIRPGEKDPKKGASAKSLISNSTQQQRAKATETSALQTPRAKQAASINGARLKEGSAKSKKKNNKRERTPEKEQDSSDENDEPSSQKSIVFKRNIPVLKRAKDKN